MFLIMVPTSQCDSPINHITNKPSARGPIGQSDYCAIGIRASHVLQYGLLCYIIPKRGDPRGSGQHYADHCSVGHRANGLFLITGCCQMTTFDDSICVAYFWTFSYYKTVNKRTHFYTRKCPLIGEFTVYKYL